MRNKHKLYSIISLCLMPGFILAASKQASNPYMSWMMENIIVVLGLLVLLGAAMTIWNLSMTMIEHNRREALRANGIEPTVEEAKSPSLWTQLNDKAWSLVPIEKESDIVLDHNYDGIRELDNSLPPWWIYGFYMSIVVAIGYLYVYHFSDIGNSQLEEYHIAMQAGEDQKAAYAARQSDAIDGKNLVMLTDADAMQVGKKVYIASCAACHGPDGQGTVGPNLTDDYWLHGGAIASVYNTIKNGVPEKGMIAWKTQLQPKTIIKVASYIKSLHGTNPPNPKAQQGEFYEEIQAAVIENELDNG